MREQLGTPFPESQARVTAYCCDRGLGRAIQPVGSANQYAGDG